MKHIKLFEEMTITEREYPEHGHDLSTREKQILVGLVGEPYLSIFKIKVDDSYYYTSYIRKGEFHHNQFDGFYDLKDYILTHYYIDNHKPNPLLELLQSNTLDTSFDDNYAIRWSSYYGYTEVVKILLQDPRVDPSDMNNYAIRVASYNGHTEIVKLLLQDPRVDPSIYNSVTIESARKNGHVEIVRLLIQDPRVRKKLRQKEIEEYEAY